MSTTTHHGHLGGRIAAGHGKIAATITATVLRGNLPDPSADWAAELAAHRDDAIQALVKLTATTPHGHPLAPSCTDRQRLQHLSRVIGSQVVSDSTGRYQRRVIPVMAHPATSLTWRLVGDPDLIRDLLTDLPLIGKHRGVGEGVVTQWDVTETPDIPHWGAGHEHEPGVLGRTVPPRCLDDGAAAGTLTGPLGAAALRPPHLHPASRTTAYHPAR